jgi:hypothetical protein
VPKGRLHGLAITENCQVVDLTGVDNPSKVVLNFKVLGENDVVSDGNGGEFVALQSLEQSSGGSSSSSNIAGNNDMAVPAMVTVGLNLKCHRHRYEPRTKQI